MFAAVAPLVVLMASLVSPVAAENEKGFLGVQLKHEEGGGIEVQAVVMDSPAEKAGLKKDDVIVKIDGNDPGELPEFVQKIGDKKPGDKIKLTVKRDGQEKTIEVTIGKKPEKIDQ